MRSLPIALLAFLLFNAQAPPESSGWSQWQVSAEIEPLPPESPAQFVRVDLTSQLMSQTESDWADLRLVDSSNQERPFALQVLNDRVEEVLHEVSLIDRATGDGYQQVVCDLGEEPGLNNQIRIETPARNFHLRVQVLGSSDRSEWLVLRDRGYLFRHLDPEASNDRILFPETSYRYLKLMLWLDGEEAIPISSVRVAHVTRREVPVQRLEAQILSAKQDLDRRSTDLELDLLFPNQHLNRARVEVSDENFRRSAELAYEDLQGRWIPAGSGTIYRFTAGEAPDEQLEIPLQDFNQRRSRLRIWNADNPPLQITRVVFERSPQTLIFRAEPGQRCRLLTGNPGVFRPNYDLDQAAARIDVLKLTTLQLGPLIANPSYRPRIIQVPWTERHPVVLWTGLAAGALLLAWLLFKTLHDLNANPGD